jgi:hypothetical protein
VTVVVKKEEAFVSVPLKKFHLNLYGIQKPFNQVFMTVN